jgi:hypothetical protein
MSVWQISLSPRCRLILDNLMSVVLGQFMDDIELTGTITREIGLSGLSTKKDDPAGEKVGTDRLGDSDIFKNLGVTFFLLTGLFLVVIVIVGLLFFLCRNFRLCVCFKNKIKATLKKIFFNAIIRYTLLNTLKLNMTAMIGLGATGFQLATSVSLLATMNLLPLLYTYVLIKKGDSLHTEETTKRYGTLYAGLRLNRMENPEKRQRVWIYTMSFMFRRSLFMVLTVFAFDYPIVQIVSHIVLTLVALCYLLNGPLFERRSQQYVEVLNEVLLLIISILISACLNATTPEAKVTLGDSILALLGLMFLINFSYIGHKVVTSKKAKCRAKKVA